MGCAGLKPKIEGINNRIIQIRYGRQNANIQFNKGKEQQGFEELQRQYDMDNDKGLLGAGMYGRVYEAVHKADKNNKVAIKVLDKMHLIDQLDAIEQEIAIL